MKRHPENYQYWPQKYRQLWDCLLDCDLDTFRSSELSCKLTPIAIGRRAWFFKDLGYVEVIEEYNHGNKYRLTEKFLRYKEDI